MGEGGFSEIVVANDSVVKTGEANVQLGANNELLLQVNEMIEKNEGVWRCKVCGKMMKRDKTFPNRFGLGKHISGIHSELFSCNICGKSGMNKESLRHHKRRQHKSL